MLFQEIKMCCYMRSGLLHSAEEKITPRGSCLQLVAGKGYGCKGNISMKHRGRCSSTRDRTQSLTLGAESQARMLLLRCIYGPFQNSFSFRQGLKVKVLGLSLN